MNDVRTLKDLPLPMEVVSYDPEVEGDFNQEEFFAELVGPEGHFQVDTSKQGMEMVEKTLADVKKKKKQFDKFNKKLGKMEGHFQVDTSKQGMEMVDKTLAD